MLVEVGRKFPPAQLETSPGRPARPITPLASPMPPDLAMSASIDGGAELSPQRSNVTPGAPGALGLSPTNASPVAVSPPHRSNSITGEVAICRHPSPGVGCPSARSSHWVRHAFAPRSVGIELHGEPLPARLPEP